MDYFYSDYGNHEAWTSALQGGSYCRVNKVYRFFEGISDLRPCIGSNYFRLDSQISVNNAASLGALVQEYTGHTPSDEFVSPVGIVEDENSEHGRYFYLHYVADGNGELAVTTLRVADSSYTDEMAVLSGVDVWSPPVSILRGAEVGMRVVNIAGDEPEQGKTFLYYLEPTGTTTNIYYVQLPDNGDPVSSDVPVKVLELDTSSRSRFYVTHVRDDIVALYVGDDDRTQDRRTTAIIHNPVLSSVLAGPAVIATGSVPFPQSYACCRGRGDEIHMVLEPPSSWRDGWGTLNSDKPGTGGSEGEPGAPQRKSSGNAWSLATLIEEGRVVEDQILFTGNDLQPWLGGTSADSFGDRYRAAVAPWFLGRQSPPPAKFADTFGNVPTFDISTSYFLTASVGARQPDTDEEATFLQRVDKVSNLRNTYGNHRSSSNWENEVAQPNIPEDARRKLNFLVPGTVMIEPQDNATPGIDTPVNTVGYQAARLDNWRLADNSSVYGEPGGSSVVGPAPVNEQNPGQNPSTDCTHGVQAGLFDESLGFVVGWFTNGAP